LFTSVPVPPPLTVCTTDHLAPFQCLATQRAGDNG
jgi:hypothetical protein